MDYWLNIGCSRQGAPFTWKDASNGHVVLLGQSGRGKSYAVKKFLLQLPEQGVRAYIFDCSGDFGEENVRLVFSECPIPTEVYDVRSQVKINPFRPLKLSPAYTEEAADTAARLTSMILDAYRFRGSAQPIHLRRALADFKTSASFVPTFAALSRFIEADEKRSLKMGPALDRLKDLARLFPCSEEGFDWRLNQPGITILRFDTIPDRAAQTLITELLLSDLWAQKLSYAEESVPIVVLLDECQRFRFNDTSMLMRILREGRKFHISGWFATQWISDKNATQALEQAALRAYFYPGDKNIHTLAKMLCPNSAQIKRYENLIRGLGVGQFLYADQDGHILLNCVPR